MNFLTWLTRSGKPSDVLAAIAQEPRILPKASQIQFSPEEETYDSFVFTVAVQPIAGGDSVSLGLEVAL